jgi:acyl-coenzyme A synthetase/AMP-(fatty) acid ligase
MLDRNIEKGYANKLALIWEGENYEAKFFTYKMLLCEVNKFCNVLRSFDLKKGDRVSIYLPNLAETVIAVLACYRMGVLFNTVFSGFSANALRERLNHFEPHVFITADGIYRRGRVINLKEKADIAKPMSPHRIRHSAITAALELTNGNVRLVQDFSRHAKLETLQVYDDNRHKGQAQVTELLATLV